MKAGAWKGLAVASGICMIAVVAIAALIGGCSGMIECTTGQVPMKCHWTFIAISFIGCIGVVSSLCAFVAKSCEARRIAAVITLVTCAVIVLVSLPTGIGLCAKAEMSCHQTALYVWIATGIAAVLSLVQLVKADPQAADKPKMEL